jgi:signal transduction histidine kinase
MIVLLIVLTVGWVLLAVFGALSETGSPAFYWVALSLGTVFIGLLLLGVVLYLVLSIKAINLTNRQSNFIDSVTHELKSPIASMKLCLQTLNRRSLSQEEQSDFYRFMLEDVERLDLLINQVLDARGLESGRIDGEVEDVPLADLLRHCAEAVCLRYRVPKETIELDLQECIVPARQIDLDMIFRNLLDNAMKYAGAEPLVEVSLEHANGSNVVVRICDNGRGIPHKMRRKIFGRFVRLGLELQREKPGTGLGLHIVRTAVRRLRGRVCVHDRDEGPGTVFEVWLPEKPITTA